VGPGLHRWGRLTVEVDSRDHTANSVTGVRALEDRMALPYGNGSLPFVENDGLEAAPHMFVERWWMKW
jgi:hypothetical protein